MTNEARRPNGRTLAGLGLAAETRDCPGLRRAAAGTVPVVSARSRSRPQAQFRGLGSLLAACGLCLLLSFACERPPSEQFTPQLVLHGALLAGDTAVQVSINRSYAIDEQFDTLFPGAAAVVRRGQDTWPLLTVERDLYSAITLPISAGDTFSIRVAKDGFDTAYAHTVVPDTFLILYPRNGDTVTLNDSMTWTRSRNCAGYYMSIQSVRGQDTSYFDVAYPNDTTLGNYDSTRVKIPQMLFLYVFEPGLHTLQLCALDTNYYAWVGGSGFGGGGDSSSVTGGLGVFGSAVMRAVQVYVKPDSFGGTGMGDYGLRRSQRPEAR
jgi:hypothetical protein